MKIFDWDARLGGYFDNISKNSGTITNGLIQETSKGKALICKGASLLYFENSQSLYSFIIGVHLNSSINATSPFNCLGSLEDTTGLISFNNTAGFLISETLTLWNTTTNNVTYIRDEFSLGWHNIVFNWNGLSYDIWVDGIKRTTYAPLGNHAELSVGNISLGKRYSNNNYFTGNILYFKAWDSALTNIDILKLYDEFQNSYPIKELNRPFFSDKKVSDLTKELGLILAYNMKSINGEISDISGNGEDGLVYKAKQTVDGMSFIESGSYIRTSSNNLLNGSTQLTICVRFKINSFINNDAIIFSRGSNLNGLTLVNTGNIRLYINSVNITGTINILSDVWVNVISTWSGITQTGSIYINGVKDISISLTETSLNVDNFWKIGLDEISDIRNLKGEISDIRLYNRVLTNKEIRAYNDLFEKKITLKDNFDDNIINGNILGWKVGSGIFKAGEASITETWIPSAVENGGGSGTGDWLNPISGVAEHWTVAIPGSTPQTGLRTWSVTTSSGFIGNVQRCQSNDILPTTLCSEPFVLDIGNSYRIRFKYKSTYSGIISTMYYYNGSSYVPVSGMPDLSERTFTTTTTATEVSWNFMLVDEPGPYVIYWNYAGTYCSAGEYMEFDEVYIDKLEYIETLFPPEIDTSGYINQYKFIECTSDGSISTQSNLAYGTWEFDVYKDDANECSVSIVNVLNTIGTGRYVLTIYNNDSIALLRDSTVLFQTVDSYISDMIWYRLKITRDLNGKFHVYIKGGDFGERYIIVDTTGGSGVNPVTDTNYTISKYIVLDMDTGDRFRALKNMGLVTDTPNNELSAVLNLTF